MSGCTTRKPRNNPLRCKPDLAQFCTAVAQVGLIHGDRNRKSAAASTAPQTAVAVLAAISVCHLLNDVIQSLIVALYPMIKETLSLDFRQIGLITFTFTFTASLLQPVVGYVTDRHPTPYSLVAGMGCSLLGLIIAAFASTYGLILVAVGLIGMGSSVFHPNHRAWRAWPPAGSTASPSRCSRSAAISAPRSARCSRPSSCCPMGRAASPGSQSSL